MSKKLSTQEWWSNKVRQNRETTVRLLEGRFPNARVRPFGGDVMAWRYEAYTIITEAVSHEQLKAIKRLGLELIEITAYVQDSDEKAMTILTVQRDGVENNQPSTRVSA